MKKSIFRLLAKFNKVALPKYYKRDLTKLKTWEKAIVGYKYWVTTNALNSVSIFLISLYTCT